jgi:hypothetical protein
MKSINVRKKRVKHLLQLWELSELFNGILPTSQGFQGWGLPGFFKIAPFE